MTNLPLRTAFVVVAFAAAWAFSMIGIGGEREQGPAIQIPADAHAVACTAFFSCHTGGTLNSSPYTPALVSPADAAVVAAGTQTLTATFSDPNSADTGTINFQLCAGPTCTATGDPIATGSSTTGLANGSNGSWTTGSLANGEYYWRAQNQDNSNALSGWSTTRLLTVGTARDVQPLRPEAAAPAPGETTADTTPILQSTAFADAASGATHAASQWQVRSDAGSWSSPVVDTGETATSLVSHTLVGALAEGRYWFRMRHKASNGLWSWYSTERSFWVSTSSAVTITSAPSITVWHRNVTITWDTDVSSTTEVHYGTTSQATPGTYAVHSVFGTPAGTAHSRTLSNLAPGTYYFRVQSQSLAGGAAYSAEYTFTIPSGGDTTPLDGLVLDGEVTALAESAGTLYVGGSFTTVGPRLGNAVLVDGSTAASATHAEVAGTSVLDSVSDGAGGWYLVGTFSYVGGLPRASAVHILPDGGVDPNWVADANAAVNEVAFGHGVVYLGGAFTTINATTRNRIAAVSPATGALTTWDPNVSSTVNAIDVTDAAVYAGGAFTTVNNGATTRNRLAAFDATTGTSTAWDPNANNTVYSLVVPGSVAYPGGLFTIVNGGSRLRIGGFWHDTGVRTAWNPGAGSTVQSVWAAPDALYVGGSFTTLGGVSRGYAGAVGYDGTLTTWNPAFNSTVYDLARSGTTTYVGGNFTTAASGTARRYAAAFDGTGALLSWDPAPAGGYVATVGVSGSSVHLGGLFSTAGGTTRNRAAAIDVATGTLTAWNPDLNGTAEALAVAGSTVYLGGSFTTANGGTVRNRAAAVDATSGTLTSWDANVSSTVHSIAVDGSVVYLGGAFSSVNAGAASRSRAAAVDATTGTATSWNPSVNSTVYSIATDSTHVFLGGAFTTIGGTSMSRLASVDTAGTLELWGSGANSTVYSLRLVGSSVYAVGSFTTAGGISRGYGASVHYDGTVQAWDPAIGSTTTRDVVVDGSNAWVGGTFTTVGGAAHAGVARVDASTGTVNTWDPQLSTGGVRALATSCGRLFVGGNFAAVGSLAQRSIATFPIPNTCVPPPPDPVRDGTAADLDYTTVTSSLSANWDAVSYIGLNRYEYCVSTATGCAGTILQTWTSNALNTTFTISSLSLAEGSTHYVCVRSIDDAEVMSLAPNCSDGQTIDTQAPLVPTLVSPADGATAVSPALTATYDDQAPASPGVVEFQLCSDSACTSVVESGASSTVSDGTNGSWTPATSTAGTYWWRARNKDGAGTVSAWTTTRSYVQNTPPGVPSQVTPSDASWVTSDTPSLTATFTDPDAGDTGQLEFELCLSNATDPWSTNCASGYGAGTSPDGISSGANGSWAPNIPLLQTTYWWRVRAHDAGAATSGWSGVRSFTVDSLPPTTPQNVRPITRGLGKVEITWDPSTDTGIGGVVYNVATSTDGSTWTNRCVSITETYCSEAGLGGAVLVYFRVQACDALGNCSQFITTNQATATAYYLRTTLNTTLLGTTNKPAVLPPVGTAATTSSIKHHNGTGWFIMRPNVTDSTVSVASEPADTPHGTTTGAGWIIDDYAGKSAAGGPIEMVVTTTSSASGGVGVLQCRLWKVATSAGTISSAQFLSKHTLTADAVDGLTTTHTCNLNGPADQTLYAANESLYVELWLNVSVGASANTRLTLTTDDSSSYLAAPLAGIPPDTPTLVSPASSTLTSLTPTLTATYAHPASETGSLEFQLSTTSDFSAIATTGSSASLSPGTNGSFTTQQLAQGTTYWWRARAIDNSGRLSAWSSAWTIVTASAPAAPTNMSPAAGATDVSLTPTLAASGFTDVDAGDSHSASQWQVRTASGSYSESVADSGTTTTSLTSWPVPVALLQENTQYSWRVRYRDSWGLWSAWSTETSFTTFDSSASSVTIGVDATTKSILPSPLIAGEDGTASTTITIGSTSATGYALTATDTSDTAGASCDCGTSVSDWGGTDLAPTQWAAGTDGYWGLTVRDATGGRLAKWGAGTATAETDFVDNNYAGLDSSTATVLHSESAANTGGTVVTTHRFNPSLANGVGTFTATVTYTVTANA